MSLETLNKQTDAVGTADAAETVETAGTAVKSAAPAPDDEILPRTGHRKKKVWGTVAFILMNVLVLGYTAQQEFGGKSESLRGVQIRPLYLLGAVGCVLVLFAAATYQYVVLMRTTCGKASLRVAFEVFALGKYYDNITPSGIGGQPFQIWYLAKEGLPAGPSAAMPVAGFLSTQFAFAFLAIVMFLTEHTVIESPAVRATAYVGLCFYLFVPVLVVLFTAAPRTTDRMLEGCLRFFGRIHLIKNPQNKIDSTLNTLSDYRASILSLLRYRRLLPAVMLPALLYQVATCCIPWFVLRAFGGTLGFLPTLAACVYIYAAITIIPTPGNSGAAEGSFYALFSSLTGGYLFWSMLVWRFLCYYIFLLLGVLIYACRAFGRRMRRRRGEAR